MYHLSIGNICASIQLSEFHLVLSLSLHVLGQHL